MSFWLKRLVSRYLLIAGMAAAVSYAQEQVPWAKSEGLSGGGVEGASVPQALSSIDPSLRQGLRVNEYQHLSAWPALSALGTHPRLVAAEADWKELAARRAADPELEAYVQALIEAARTEVQGPRLERIMTGKRLLFVSRQLLRSVVLCSFAYRVRGEQVFLDRARQDLLDAAAFSDWNPSHFLDVAEMATGMALGYDWLYGNLSETERQVIREALKSKALSFGEKGHSSFKNDNNWAQVCGGGLSLAALAIAEDDPALSNAVLTQVRASLHRPLGVYAPDGVYPEGPDYWGYGTLYQVLLVASLRSALGEDWGILESPGFVRSAVFVAQCTAPSGLRYNYGDSWPSEGINEPLCYLAKELGEPRLAWNTRRLLGELSTGTQGKLDRLAPLLAFWWPFGPEAVHAKEPACFFSGQGKNPVAVWRSAWGDRRARYFAIKAGGAGVSHGHMDAGSFVLEWQGQRWASDLGIQAYQSLEEKGVDLWNMRQDSPRWRVFRLGSSAHNTLSLDGALHQAKALAPLLKADEQGACIDLSPVLGLEEGQALRTVRVGKEEIVLEDKLEGVAPGTSVRWALGTAAKAEIEASGSSVLLQQGGERLRLVFEGSAVLLRVESIAAPVADFDAANPGLSQVLAFARVHAGGRAVIRVRFEAGE